MPLFHYICTDGKGAEREGDVEAASRAGLLEQIMKRGWTVLSVEVVEPAQAVAVAPSAHAPVAHAPVASTSAAAKPLKPYRALAFKIVGGLQIFFGGAAALIGCSDEFSRHTRLIAAEGVVVASRIPMDFTVFYSGLGCFALGILVFSFGEWMIRIDARLGEMQLSRR
ncbi:MAG: hypothetical protein RLY72_2455 [Planctomycetota bacterium]